MDFESSGSEFESRRGHSSSGDQLDGLLYLFFWQPDREFRPMPTHSVQNIAMPMVMLYERVSNTKTHTQA